MCTHMCYSVLVNITQIYMHRVSLGACPGATPSVSFRFDRYYEGVSNRLTQ